MSELEKQEIINRVKAMPQEEQILTVKGIPSDVLWDELKRRDGINRTMIAKCREELRIGE